MHPLHHPWKSFKLVENVLAIQQSAVIMQSVFFFSPVKLRYGVSVERLKSDSHSVAAANAVLYIIL